MNFAEFGSHIDCVAVYTVALPRNADHEDSMLVPAGTRAGREQPTGYHDERRDEGFRFGSIGLEGDCGFELDEQSKRAFGEFFAAGYRNRFRRSNFLEMLALLERFFHLNPLEQAE